MSDLVRQLRLELLPAWSELDAGVVFSHKTEVEWKVKAAFQKRGDGNSWLQADNAVLIPPRLRDARLPSW